MPLYEYACQVCEHHFDVRHSYDETPQLSCPVCEGSVRKVFHAAGIIFKGSGWYIKDHAKKDAVSTDTPAKVETPPASESSPPAPAAATAE
jgi:putative FmdB family regulatory protein